jgi:hypothetical protein
MPPTELEHPVNGRRLRFKSTPTDPANSPIHYEIESKEGQGFLLPFQHPKQNKRLSIESGAADVAMGNDTRRLQAGETCDIPHQTPHDWRNANYDERLVVSVALTPALHTLEAYQALWTMPSESLHPNGQMKFLQFCVFQDIYWGIVAAARPSPQLQKLTARTLAPLGRLLGYRPEYREKIESD